MALNFSTFEGLKENIQESLSFKFPKVDRARSCSDRKMTIIFFVKRRKTFAFNFNLRQPQLS